MNIKLSTGLKKEVMQMKTWKLKFYNFLVNTPCSIIQIHLIIMVAGPAVAKPESNVSLGAVWQRDS